MQTTTTINLPEKEIVNWHGRLLQEARQSADLCLKNFDDPDAHENVRRLVSDTKVCELIGAPPNGIKLEDGHPGDYEQWLFNLWGRRCSYYLSSLIDGLNAAKKIDQSQELDSLIKDLEVPKLKLAEHFKSWGYTQITPEASLKSRGDIANFHVTYLDPVLFSSLYYLNRFRHEEHLQNKTETIDKLWRLIKREVGVSTNRGNKMSEHVIDESTVWWGFLELVNRDKEDFHLGRFKRWNGVVNVCMNLIHSNNRKIRCPQEDEKLREATPEIYGKIRTCTLVAKNCLALVKLVPAKELAGIRNELSAFVGNQFAYVIGDIEKVSKHLCFIGINLELSSCAMQTLSAQGVSKIQLTPKQKSESKENIDKQQGWIEALRGFGKQKGSIDDHWLYLSDLVCQRLGPRRLEKWFAWPVNAQCLILFPECLWDCFWKSAEKEHGLDQKSLKEHQDCCEPVICKTRVQKKRRREYTSEFWILPKNVVGQLNFSGRDDKYSLSKNSMKCRIVASGFWLKITPPHAAQSVVGT